MLFADPGVGAVDSFARAARLASLSLDRGVTLDEEDGCLIAIDLCHLEAQTEKMVGCPGQPLVLWGACPHRLVLEKPIDCEALAQTDPLVCSDPLAAEGAHLPLRGVEHFFWLENVPLVE